jgi:ribosomal protein S27E
MSEHFVNLNCANCGAKLEVYDDMDRFACSFCGTEMLVQRRGGTVALKAITEAIKKVQVGTDKTAAELAIVRLEKELDDLYEAERRSSVFWRLWMAVPASVLVLGGLVVLGDGSAWGLLMLAGGLGVFAYVFVPRQRTTELRNRIKGVEQKLSEQKKIANS